jgi:hypothetical protein
MDRDDLLAEPDIRERSIRRRPSLPGVETGAGDAQKPADQRDRKIGLLRRDEPIQAHRVSLSLTKKAAALFQDLPLLLEHQHPPALNTATPNWRPGDTIPLGRRSLRVLGIRDDNVDAPVLVVENTHCPAGRVGELTRSCQRIRRLAPIGERRTPRPLLSAPRVGPLQWAYAFK